MHRSPSPIPPARRISGDLHSPRRAGFPPPAHRSPSPVPPARRFTSDFHSPRRQGFPPHSPVAPDAAVWRADTHREREDAGVIHRDDERGSARHRHHEGRRSRSPIVPETHRSYGPSDKKRSYSPRGRRESDQPLSPNTHYRRPLAARGSSNAVMASVTPVHSSSPEHRMKSSLSVVDLNAPERDQNTPKARALFWVAKSGLDRLGTLKWIFEVNEDEAGRLGLRERRSALFVCCLYSNQTQ